MFTNSSVFILAADGQIYRLEVDKEAQQAICESFASSVDSMVKDKVMLNYEANYKPEENEIFRIENFILSDNIKKAIRDPSGVKSYWKEPDAVSEGDGGILSFPEIKAIFVGEIIPDGEVEYFNIGFQRYRKEQNLVALPVRLFFSGNTFTLEKRFEIGITNNIDCYYTGEELQFVSFYYARQVFDLREYYRIAADHDVAAFIQNKALSLEDSDAFSKIVNTYVRRKIAMISDSQVLQKYSAREIRRIAGYSGITIRVQDNRIVIPADKDAAMEVLAFLDEEAYRGPFTNDLLIANSKRVLKKA